MRFERFPGAVQLCVAKGLRPIQNEPSDLRDDAGGMVPGHLENRKERVAERDTGSIEPASAR